MIVCSLLTTLSQAWLTSTAGPLLLSGQLVADCGKTKGVRDVNMKFGLIPMEFHGCMLGLKSSKGKPMKKPWRVDTNMSEFHDVFGPYQCNHKPHEHDPVQGKDTKLTEGYTWPFVQCVHNSFKIHTLHQYGEKSQCSLSAPHSQEYNGYHFDLDDCSTCADGLSDAEELDDDRETWEGIPMMPCVSSANCSVDGHRDKHGFGQSSPQPVYSAMVHQLLTPKQVKSDAKAQAALMKEAKKHSDGGTWNLKTVREAADVLREARAKGIEIHMGHIFGIALSLIHI